MRPASICGLQMHTILISGKSTKEPLLYSWVPETCPAEEQEPIFCEFLGIFFLFFKMCRHVGPVFFRDVTKFSHDHGKPDRRPGNCLWNHQRLSLPNANSTIASPVCLLIGEQCHVWQGPVQKRPVWAKDLLSIWWSKCSCLASSSSVCLSNLFQNLLKFCLVENLLDTLD